MRPFYCFPLIRLEETSEAAALSVRTLPEPQLRAEREALRAVCAAAVGIGPAALLLSLYDAEAARREREGFR